MKKETFFFHFIDPKFLILYIHPFQRVGLKRTKLLTLNIKGRIDYALFSLVIQH